MSAKRFMRTDIMNGSVFDWCSSANNDHMNNYCYIESKNIKEDREIFLKTLDSYINDPQIQKMPRKKFNMM